MLLQEALRQEEACTADGHSPLSSPLCADAAFRGSTAAHPSQRQPQRPVHVRVTTAKASQVRLTAAACLISRIACSYIHTEYVGIPTPLQQQRTRMALHISAAPSRIDAVSDNVHM